MPNYSEPLYAVKYVPTDDTPEWDVETNWIPPMIGYGVIAEDGSRWRVVDVWINHEKRGAIGAYGVYVYVELAEGESDRPGQLYGSYYR